MVKDRLPLPSVIYTGRGPNDVAGGDTPRGSKDPPPPSGKGRAREDRSGWVCGEERECEDLQGEKAGWTRGTLHCAQPDPVRVHSGVSCAEIRETAKIAGRGDFSHSLFRMKQVSRDRKTSRVSSERCDVFIALKLPELISPLPNPNLQLPRNAKNAARTSKQVSSVNQIV